jgi:hypothetical protein
MAHVRLGPGSLPGGVRRLALRGWAGMAVFGLGLRMANDELGLARPGMVIMLS